MPGGFDLGWILFVEIAHGDDVFVPVKCVVVEVHLGIERDHIAAAGENQRIDFHQRRVGFPERLVQAFQYRARLRHACVGNADLACQVVGLRIGQSLLRVDEYLVDFFRRVRGDLFDVHAAFRGSHHADFLRAAVHDQSDVQLLADIGALFDQQAPHLLSPGSGLMGLELHAEDSGCPLAHFIDGLGDFDPAALAASAGMNLGFHHPYLAADFVRRGHCFVHAETSHTAGRGYAVIPENFLRLVFVNFHR